ncbi:HlyD family secretion protein [Thermoanaerobacterium thermosaccharolyticum]|uniref:HlyD family secretion protein n=1 Tax=Thermoanaerobacterium thermosaccharolyticum TaxID=1517 RepID=UPI003DA9CCBC
MMRSNFSLAKNKKSIYFLILILIYSLILSGCSNGAKTNASNSYLIDGVVENQEVDVSSKLPGRIETVKVKEGDTVKAGQVLAYLEIKELNDKEKQAEAAVEAALAQYNNAKDTYQLQQKVNDADIQAAQAALDQATAQYNKVKNGARSQEIEQAKAKLDEAKAALDVAEKSYQRTSQLFEAGAASQQTLDEVKAKYQAASDDVHYAEEALSLIQEGAQPEDIKAAAAAVEQAKAAIMKAEAGKLQTAIAGDAVKMAEANLNAAKAALDEVKANIEDATIKAPCDGIITVKNVEEGEIVSAGTPIFTIQQPKDNWVNVKVKETQVGKIKVGQKVKVTSADFPKEVFTGVVESINEKPDYAAQRSTNERDDKDIVAYNVKVRLDNEKLKAGMSVTVDFSGSKEEK